jgi:hypothetical protein
LKTSTVLKTFRILSAATFLAACFFSMGCASSDVEHRSAERPWNRPKGWESGLPVGLTEGR